MLTKAKGEARFGALYYGSTSPAMTEALDVLAAQGIHVDAMRVRGFPFAQEVKEFVMSHPGTFIIEQNRDAQLKTMLVTEEQINVDRLISVLHYDGTPITARFIADQIANHIAAHTVVPMKKAAS